MNTELLTDLSSMDERESNECIKKELYDAGIHIVSTKVANDHTVNDDIGSALKYINEDLKISEIFGRGEVGDWKLFRTEKTG